MKLSLTEVSMAGRGASRHFKVAFVEDTRHAERVTAGRLCLPSLNFSFLQELADVTS